MRLLFILLLASLSPARAGNFSSTAKAGATAVFLEAGVGARAVAMGEAYSAAADEASALYWNPGALTNIEKHSVTLMHAATTVNQGFFDYGAYARNLGSQGAAGAGFQYFTPGSLTQTDDATGADLGTLTLRDMAFTLGYAHLFHGWSVGAAGKVIQSRIITSANTLAADAGLLSPAFLDGKLRVAATAANLGGSLRFENESAGLPVVFKAGGAYRILDGWLATLDAGFPSDNRPYAAVGTEYVMPVAGKGWTLAGRAGFNSRTAGDAPGFYGASFGVGLAFQGSSVDYAFLPYGLLGGVHRVSLSFKWGRPGGSEEDDETSSEKR